MKTVIRQFKRRRLACAIAVAAIAAASQSSVSPALAADMPAQVRPAAVVQPLWTGFYLGVHGGGAWGTTHLEDPAFRLTFFPVDIKSSGALAGAQLGANWQFSNNIVVGGEIDASWTSVRGSTPGDPDFASPFTGFVTKVRAMATGTGRVGYASGAWLGYVKGGVAWADIEWTDSADTPPPQGPRRYPHTRTGITGGAGLEVAFWRNLSAKLEYNAIYFGPHSISSGSAFNGPARLDHLFHVVKGGINVRFGGDYLAARH